MTTTFQVSAIIPNFNHNHLLRRAVVSAIQNGCHPIVVDDHSDEDPYDLIKDLPITYVRHRKNSGLAIARNTGIQLAETEWIIPVDADDELYYGVVDKMLEKDGDIIYGNLVWRGSNSQMKATPEITYDNFLVNNQLFGSSLYKKKVWESVGGYWDEHHEYYEDWCFWAKASKSGFKFTYIDLDIYIYGGEPDGMCARIGKKRDYNVELVTDYIKKWKPRRSQ